MQGDFDYLKFRFAISRVIEPPLALLADNCGGRCRFPSCTVPDAFVEPLMPLLLLFLSWPTLRTWYTRFVGVIVNCSDIGPCTASGKRSWSWRSAHIIIKYPDCIPGILKSQEYLANGDLEARLKESCEESVNQLTWDHARASHGLWHYKRGNCLLLWPFMFPFLDEIGQSLNLKLCITAAFCGFHSLGLRSYKNSWCGQRIALAPLSSSPHPTCNAEVFCCMALCHLLLSLLVMRSR